MMSKEMQHFAMTFIAITSIIAQFLSLIFIWNAGTAQHGSPGIEMIMLVFAILLQGGAIAGWVFIGVNHDV